MTTTFPSDAVRQAGALWWAPAFFVGGLALFWIKNSLNRLLDDDQVIAWHRTGSRYICDPPPAGSDDDRIVLVAKLPAYLRKLSKSGFTAACGYSCLQERTGWSPYVSLRRDEINLVVTDINAWYERYVLATKAARRLNLLKKTDRIALFHSILYDN